MPHIGRIPPYNEEAETAVIGGILMNNEVIRAVRGSVESADFYSEAHRRIFQAVEVLADNLRPIDHVTLADELRRQGDLEKIGGVAKLAYLTDAVATVANIEHYAEIVHELSLRRSMIYAGNEITAEGYVEDVPLSDYLAGSRSRVVAVTNQLHRHCQPVPIGDTVDDAVTSATADSDPPGRVLTRCSDVDRKIGGLWPGITTILAGRPAMGKSVTALNWIVNAAMAGENVLVFSMEDATRFVHWRIFARLCKINLARILQRRLTDEEKAKIENYRDLISRLPIWIVDNPALKASDIRDITLRHFDQHGVDLVVLDHLGHINEPGKLFEATTRAMRTVNTIPKEIDRPFLCLHQLNRATEDRKVQRPQLSDLRQSGEIEQIARVVLFLYRESYYDESKDPNNLELIIAKNNHGKTGLVKLFCDLPEMFVGDHAEETTDHYNQY